MTQKLTKAGAAAWEEHDRQYNNSWDMSNKGFDWNAIAAAAINASALQSQLSRLSTAARASVAEWQSYIDNGECSPDAETAYTVCINDTLANLSEIENP